MSGADGDGDTTTDGDSDAAATADGDSDDADDADDAATAATADAAGDSNVASERDGGPRSELTDTLAGRRNVVGVGVDVDTVPAVIAARRRTVGGCWRIACRPGVVEELGRTVGLGTAVAEARARGELAVRTATGPRPDRTLFATPDRTDALAGPDGERTFVTETDPERTAAVHSTIEARFERAEPVRVDMPHRTAVLAAARRRLGSRFADDLEVALETVDLDPDALDRTRTVDDRTLFVALGARHDLLFTDVRQWADDLNVVEAQRFADARRTLESRGLVESVRVPIGNGRPNNRLRAADEILLTVEPAEFLQAVRECVAGLRPTNGPESGSRTGIDYRDGDRPVWDRRR